MANYNNTWRNQAWLGWLLMQLPIILCKLRMLHMKLIDEANGAVIDLLDFIWPAWVYEPPAAPLHVFYTLKEWYIKEYNDPIVQWSATTATGHDSWMGLFLYLELAFLLPTVLYGIYRLGVQRRGTSGADELLFFVYALEMAFTTLVCIFDSFYWDSTVYSADLKRTFWVQFYGPWFVICKCLRLHKAAHRLTKSATLGAIDMATRILGRIQAADAVLQSRKLQ